MELGVSCPAKIRLRAGWRFRWMVVTIELSILHRLSFVLSFLTLENCVFRTLRSRSRLVQTPNSTPTFNFVLTSSSLSTVYTHTLCFAIPVVDTECLVVLLLIITSKPGGAAVLYRAEESCRTVFQQLAAAKHYGAAARLRTTRCDTSRCRSPRSPHCRRSTEPVGLPPHRDRPFEQG